MSRSRAPVDLLEQRKAPAAKQDQERALEAAIADARKFLELMWRHGKLGADRLYGHPHNRWAMALIKSDQRMPEYLRKHVCALLENDIRRERARPSFRCRDQCIRVAVFLVTEQHRFHPTRNALTRNKITACGIVASVLGEFGVRLSERSIVRIYQKAPVRK